jgi:hypothetical protein
VERFDEELKKISENISVLSSAKASSIQVRDTSSTTGFRQTISTTELRLAAKRIEVEEENRKNTYAKREIVADSLQKYQLNILELQSNNEIAAELGPLQYLSGLTGIPMDKIINVLLLIIIFVFDPLAISLVVAANFAFDKAYPRKKYRENLYEEKVEIKEKEEFDWDKAEKRMNVIGQNGNDGEHYSEEQPDASKMSDRLKRKRSILREMLEDKGGWNGNIERVEERIDKALKEIDDNTKTY